jgi:hypothetical protein
VTRAFPVQNGQSVCMWRMILDSASQPWLLLCSFSTPGWAECERTSWIDAVNFSASARRHNISIPGPNLSLRDDVAVVCSLWVVTVFVRVHLNSSRLSLSDLPMSCQARWSCHWTQGSRVQTRPRTIRICSVTYFDGELKMSTTFCDMLKNHTSMDDIFFVDKIHCHFSPSFSLHRY